MRILVVQESNWIERGPHQSHHLFERLKQRGHEIRVIDFDIGWRSRSPRPLVSRRKRLRGRAKVIPGSDILVIRPPTLNLPVLDYVSLALTHRLEIHRQIREFRPDVLVGLGILNAHAGIRLARRAGIPFVYYLIDELHQLVPQPLFRGLARSIERGNMRRASLVLAINQALRDYALAMGATPERAKVIPAGIDVELYRWSGDGVIVRERLGLASDDLVLFFMGWVYEFSGIREIAERLAMGEGREEHVKLLVVGKGDVWQELATMAKKRAAEDRIKMVGFRPYAEMPGFLAAADVCLLPAYDIETMRNIVPIKVYEYLAAGKPVIATELPGLVKEFGEGHGVVYVRDPRDVIRMATDLARAGALQELGAAGREFVARNDWTSITDSFESLLESLTNRPGARASPRA
ncbi:MAG TPA: glycosyltransferase [Thermoplasmata archaeon]|nr:glycosyltransferase [Thermoplasmata archaeon]